MYQEKNKALWNEVQKQAKSGLDVWKKRNSESISSSSSALMNGHVDEQAFLNEKLPKELGEILEYWHTNHSLDKTQKDTFGEYSEYLLKFSKNNSEATKWFSQQTKLIDLAKKCTDDIASHGYYLDIKGAEDPNIESFDKLIQAFTNSDSDQLLDSIVRCISNDSYNETLYKLGKDNASALSLTQQFLLVTCPDYILTCDRDKSHVRKHLEHMLNHYAELFTHFLPNIEKWTDTVVLCLLYPIRFVLSDPSVLPLEEKRHIQEALVTILLKQPLSDSNHEEERIILVHVSLNVLLEIVRSEPKLLGELKKQTTDNDKLLVILKQLSDDKRNEKVQLQAFELVSFLVPEEEFVRANDSAKVTELFVKNFNEALEDNKDQTAGDLIQGLKGLVRSDEVKQQVVDQNAIPSIIQYTKEAADNPAPLELAYALSFNPDAKTAFSEDREFVDHVEKMKQSDNKEVANAAHGIMWKLEDEEKFTKEAEEKKLKEQATKETKESTEATKEPTQETKEPTQETKESPKETKEPAKETKEQAKETKEPAKETKEPAKETKEPAKETKEPAKETKEPAKETKEPAKETKEPVKETKELAKETKEPAKETKESTKETKEPAKETKESTKETKESTDDKEKPEQYDMMISYCWAQKELCHRINDRLEKEGYSVWLDRDEMRGSIVESMAEAVENSKCVLICMSSDYKSSTNCQAEAEYAYNRKMKIIPLMVEKDYKPDGWLGFMAGSKLYVDFADKDDEEFDKAYELLIAEIKRQEVDDNAEHEKKEKEKSDADSSAEKETDSPAIATKQYLSVGPATMWTDSHVNEFLTDNELKLLLPICKSMDGGVLLEFHQACQAMPSAMLTAINKSIGDAPVTMDAFFKFILKLKEHLPPPKPPPKIFFQYSFTYAPSTTNVNPAKTNTN